MTTLNTIFSFLGDAIAAGGRALMNGMSGPAFAVTAIVVAAFGILLIRATRPRG